MNDSDWRAQREIDRVWWNIAWIAGFGMLLMNKRPALANLVPDILVNH
jgi:hypothetical protein